jgi:peptidoglycan/LPS O-acetylase OafA/YrhL
MRITNIQILRVIAAVGVAVFHTGFYAAHIGGTELPWHRVTILGGFPVPLFFAVSGFVLIHALRSATLPRFLLARALRIYPGYWLALLAAFAFMRCGLFTDFHQGLTHYLTKASFLLWPEGSGFTVYLLGIEWSLIYEVFLSASLAALSVFGVRRGVPVLAGLWLAVLTMKMAFWPGYAFKALSPPSTIVLSVYNVPFLMGVLTYYAREWDRRWAWLVLPLTLAMLGAVSFATLTNEQVWYALGVAAAGTLWLAVQLPQVKETNPLVRLGDCTYGLFLLHVPLLFVVYYTAEHTGWHGRVEVVWLAGAVAIGGGLFYGRLESAIHSRLRPLAKVKLSSMKVLLTLRVRRLSSRGA